MRKWLFIPLFLIVAYILSRINQRKKVHSRFFKRLKETFSILAWVLLAVYTLSFLYWLYTVIFR